MRLALAALGWRLFGPALRPRFRPGQSHPWRIPASSVFVGDRRHIVYLAGPEDGPPVVLLHGLGGSALGEWFRVGPLLADRFRLIVPDLPGHGLGPADGSPDIDDVADDVVGILDALGLTDVDVVGYSMGAAIAVSLAGRRPGRVRRLVLVGAPLHHGLARRVVLAAGMVALRGWERLTGLGVAEGRWLYLHLRRAVPAGGSRFLWEETHRRDPEAATRAGLALLRFDGRPRLAGIACPTLVVVPEKDQLVPPARQRAMAGLMPRAEVVTMDSGHELVWTHPDDLARLVADFLA